MELKLSLDERWNNYYETERIALHLDATLVVSASGPLCLNLLDNVVPVKTGDPSSSEADSSAGGLRLFLRELELSDGSQIGLSGPFTDHVYVWVEPEKSVTFRGYFACNTAALIELGCAPSLNDLTFELSRFFCPSNASHSKLRSGSFDLPPLPDFSADKFVSPMWPFAYQQPINWWLHNGMLLNGSEQGALKKADIGSFELLTQAVARDKNNVYFNSYLSKTADLESLEALNVGYFKDKNKVFNRLLEGVKGADLATFDVLDNGLPGYARDANTVWCAADAVMDRPRKVLACKRPDLFKVMAKDYPFGRDDKFVYFRHSKLKADVHSWAYLCGEYSKDKNHVFYGNEVIGHYDHENNRISTACPTSWQHLAGHYSCDETAVYYCNKAIEGVTPECFEVLITVSLCGARVERETRHSLGRCGDTYYDALSLVENTMDELSSVWEDLHQNGSDMAHITSVLESLIEQQ